MGGLGDALKVRLLPVRPQDDVGAVDLLGVEPQLSLARLPGGEGVVLGVVLAHRNPQPRRGPKLHGPGLHLQVPLAGLAPLAEIAGAGELLPDLQQVPLPLGQLDSLQYAVQIVQLPPALLDLLREHPLGGLGLVIFLVILGGVLLGREKRVQRDVHLPPLGVVVVRQPGRAHSLLQRVQVGGKDVPQLPLALPVLRGRQLQLLLAHPAGGAIPYPAHRLQKLLPLLPGALGGLPGGVKVLQQLGKAGIGPRLRPRSVL